MLIQSGSVWRRWVRLAFSSGDAFRALLAGRDRRLRRRMQMRTASLESLETRMLLAAVVTTDLPDYAPGSTAVFTAASDGGADHNFQVGEAVRFQVVRTDGFADHAPGNAPWVVTDGVGGFDPYQNDDGTWIAPDIDGSADGRVGTTWYVDAQYAGAWLQLQATGLKSGEFATIDFTDSAVGNPTGIGTAANNSSSRSISVPLNSGVVVGNRVLVAIAMDPSSTTVGVTDTSGNSYSKDADVTNLGGNSTSGVRTLVFSAPVTTALSSGNSLTVSFGANVAAKAISVFSASGLAGGVVARDQVATGFGQGTSPSSGTTGSATVQSHELLFNVIGDEDRTVSFNAGSNFTALTQATVDGGSPASSMTVLPQFRIVTSKGTFSASGTVDQSNRWASALVTYKAALSTVTAVSSSGSSSTYGNSVTFTATVTTSAPATETPAGSVEFYDGTTLLGAGSPLSGSGNSATSTFTLSTLSAGSHSSIRAVFTGSGTFTSSTSSNFTQVVSPRAITIAAAPAAKTYDGTTSAPGTATLASGTIVPGHTASFSQVFEDRNAGSGKKLTPAAVIRDADGADVTSNYAVTEQTANGTIHPKALTVEGLTAVSRSYDGTTNAALTGVASFLTAEAAGTGSTTDGKPYSIDAVSPGGSAKGAFASRDAGSDKAVTVRDISVSGSGNGNYIVVQPAGLSATVTPRELAVSVRASNKSYDGNVTASVSLSDDRISGDVLIVSSSAAEFGDKNAGDGKAVVVSGITLSGADAANYSLSATTAVAHASIQPRHVSGSFTVADKVYDGTTVAAITERMPGAIVAGDDVSLTGGAARFADKNAGMAKVVALTGATLSGEDAGNYILDGIANSTARITPRELTVTASGIDKTYDGTRKAEVALSDNRLGGDEFNINSESEFRDPNVGVGKAVSVQGIVLSGVDAGNYSANEWAAANADIFARVLTVTGTAADKDYDGNVSARVNLVDDRVEGDSIAIAIQSAEFADPEVGDGKSVAVLGLSIEGDPSGNYVLMRDSFLVTASIYNSPPVVSTSGNANSAVENGMPVIVDAAAVVTDGSPNLANGTLVVSIATNGDAQDRLSIRNQPKEPGMISLIGSNVLYSQVVIGSFSGGRGLTPLVVALNENATLEAAQALVRNIQFSVGGDNPSAAARSIHFELSDGLVSAGVPGVSRVDVVPVNDAPVIETTLGETVFAELGSPVVVDGGINVGDVDSVDFNLGSLSVSIPLNGTSTDRLSIRNQGQGAGQIGISGETVRYEGVEIGSVSGGAASPLVISFNQQADAAVAQAVARNILFSSSGTAVSAEPRTVRFVLRDGDGGTSATADREVQIAAINQPAVVTAPAMEATYSENSPAVVVNGQITVSDADRPANLKNGVLVVDVSANASRDDRLSIRHVGTGASQIGIRNDKVLYGNSEIGVFRGGMGFDPLVITLNANATIGATQALFRAITFASASDAPSTLDRTVRYALTDGAGISSNVVTSQVRVVAENDAPIVVIAGGALVYLENDAATPVDSGMTVTDFDNVNFDGGTLIVDLPVNGTSKDRLEIRNQGLGAGQIGVSAGNVTYENVVIGTVSGGVGTTALVVSLNANATSAALQSLVRNVSFLNVSDAPDTASRTVKFILKDGLGGSSVAVSRQVLVTAVNDAPMISGAAGIANYTENAAAIAVLSQAIVSDADLPASLDGGTLVVDFASNGVADDRLTIRNVGTGAGQIGVTGDRITFANSVIGSFTGGEGTTPLVITLNAQASVAATQTLVRNIMYCNIGDNPGAAVRSVRFVLSDGHGGVSEAAVRQVAVTAVNDASTISGLDTAITYVEGAAAARIALGAIIADADSPDFNGGSLSVSLSTGAAAGDRLTIQGSDLISVSGNVVSYLGSAFATFSGGTGATPLIVTFNTSGNATLAATQALLRSIQFQATGSITANSSRTLKFVLKDGDGGTSLGYLETINIVNVS